MYNKIIKLSVICVLALLSACAQLPTNFEAAPSFASVDAENTTIGQQANQLLADSPEESKVHIITDGIDAFVARVSLLQLAEQTIDVQYYIWHSDLIGKLLLKEMLSAADRGVRVRILLDDMPVDGATETILYALDQHNKIEVRLFNPFASRSFRFIDYMTNPVRINRRMHNKSFSVDNQSTIIGGRNIGNEYFSAHEQSNFNDIDVLAVGPIVSDVGNQFDIFWNSDVVYPVKAFTHNHTSAEDLKQVRLELVAFAASMKDSDYHLDVQDSKLYGSINETQFLKVGSARTYRGKVEVIFDDPEKGLGATEEEIIYLKHQLQPYVENTQNTFEIISPYFVPGAAGVDYLTSLVDKNIRVRVITNSLSSTDGLMAQSGYSRRRIDLLKGGIELYEFKSDAKTDASKSLRRGDKAKSGLHAKTYIFDRQQVFIGSFNLDQRSSNINSEVGVVYDIPKMAYYIGSTLFDEKIDQIAYKVALANKDTEIGGVKIKKGQIYWEETQGTIKTYHTTEPKTGFWRRFGQGFFSLLPIESQL